MFLECPVCKSRDVINKFKNYIKPNELYNETSVGLCLECGYKEPFYIDSKCEFYHVKETIDVKLKGFQGYF